MSTTTPTTANPAPHYCDVAPDDCPVEVPRDGKNKSGNSATLTGAWLYPATAKTPPLLKVRYDGAGGKTMLWCHGLAADEWKLKLPKAASPPLYGLASIQPGEPVIVVEGEKSAAALHSLGVPAVGLPGANAAASVDLSPLDGLEVVLWPDNDKPGADAMDTLAERLARPHKRVNPAILETNPKADAADFVNEYLWAGQRVTTAAQLWQALHDALQAVEPPPPAPFGEHLPDDWLTQAVPPREFVFRDRIPLAAATLLVACGGTGKSMLSLELAASAAIGRTLISGFDPAAGPVGVALLALEDDKAEVWRRLQRIFLAFNLDYNAGDPVKLAHNLRLFCLPAFNAIAPEGNFAASDDLKRLSANLAEFKPRLVIADPLAGLLGGLIEENANEAAQAVIGILRSAIPDCAGLLVCAHTSKAERETSTTARGASAWMDAARQVIALRPVNKTETFALGNDAQLTVALQMTKSNYSALAPPVYLQRCTLPELGGVLKPFDFVDFKRKTEQARTASIAQAVVLALRDHPVTKQEAKGGAKDNDEKSKERGVNFRDAVDCHAKEKIRRTDLVACIGDLIKQGTITQRLVGKRMVLFCAAEVDSATDNGRCDL